MRTEELEKIARKRKLDLVLVADQANIRALTGINCDNAISIRSSVSARMPRSVTMNTTTPSGTDANPYSSTWV